MKQNVARALIIMTAALVMIVAVFLTGPRSRITDSANADTFISDVNSGSGVGTSMNSEEPEEKTEKEKPKEKPKEETRQKKPSATPRTTPKQRTPAKGKDGNKKGDGSGNNGKGKENGGGQGGDGSENKKSITVKLDPNGGSCEKKSIKVVEGGKYGSLPLPVKDNYTFSGWYSAAEEGTVITANTKLIKDAPHTIYAHWEKAETPEHTIAFDPNTEGGRLKNREKTRVMHEGDTFSALPLPVATGMEFQGWYTAAGEGEGILISEGDVFIETSDITLYAHWEYDPYKYWSQTLTTIYESMYACQVVDCYIEFEENVTASSCDLLSNCKAGNCARNRGSDTVVDDEWVESRNPKIIVKCVDNMGSASSEKNHMQERFPGRRVIIAPMEAEYGDNYTRLYYTLYLGKLIYPDWYEEVDIDKVGEELEVSGNLYE